MWLQTALDGLHKKMVRLSRQITKSDQQRWLYFSGQLVQSENFYLCVGNKLCECYVSLLKTKSFLLLSLTQACIQRRWYLKIGTDGFGKGVLVWGKTYLWCASKYGKFWPRSDLVEKLSMSGQRLITELDLPSNLSESKWSAKKWVKLHPILLL